MYMTSRKFEKNAYKRRKLQWVQCMQMDIQICLASLVEESVTVCGRDSHYVVLSNSRVPDSSMKDLLP